MSNLPETPRSERGNMVVVIEHNLKVIKTADWVIDLGPEGGDKGGKIVAVGVPEGISNEPTSYTGHYLKPLLQAATGDKPVQSRARAKARAGVVEGPEEVVKQVRSYTGVFGVVAGGGGEVRVAAG